MKKNRVPRKLKKQYKKYLLNQTVIFEQTMSELDKYRQSKKANRKALNQAMIEAHSNGRNNKLEKDIDE